MRIFLIRHGETVDNVAHLYAGIRNSALTVHGSLQAQRLAKFLIDCGLHFDYIFSSDLDRAVKTADEIRLAQTNRCRKESEPAIPVTVLPVLREQDFGHLEGRPFHNFRREPRTLVDKNKAMQRQHDPEHNVESKESMERRAKTFLDEHLVPIIHENINDEASTAAVISHGMILSHIWRTFLKILPKNSVILSPGLELHGGNKIALEHINRWSNTGYLELVLETAEQVPVEEPQLEPCSPPLNETPAPPPIEAMLPGKSLNDIKVIIKTLDGKDHLIGLKRTRGGVGSSKQDDHQTTIETFFKKRKP